ncbi:hypothetical protein AB0C10_37825 [Microbispora amethystogenes]|uniref:hypothetical protein n=1 Tax=Microbispora amethystogenes TaxID=1427754 RepID=UPI0033C31402
MSDYGSDDYDSDECVHCCRITSELYVVPGEPGSPQRCRDCETDRLGEDPEEWWARWRAEQSATLPRAVSEGEAR